MWTGPGPETKSITPKHAAIIPTSPEHTEKQGGIFDHMTGFSELPASGYRSWPGHNSPQSTPPALEEQPATQILSNGMNYIGFPDSEQIHDGSLIFHSNPNTPPSDGGHKAGTQESVDRWAHSIDAKFTEGSSSDSLRPSPPSSSNGDDFKVSEEDNTTFSVEMDSDQVPTSSNHSTIHDIDY